MKVSHVHQWHAGGASRESQNSLVKRLTTKNTADNRRIGGGMKPQNPDEREEGERGIRLHCLASFSNNSHSRARPSACSTLQGRRWLQTCLSESVFSQDPPSTCSDPTEQQSASKASTRVQTLARLGPRSAPDTSCAWIL